MIKIIGERVARRGKRFCVTLLNAGTNVSYVVTSGKQELVPQVVHDPASKTMTLCFTVPKSSHGIKVVATRGNSGSRTTFTALAL